MKIRFGLIGLILALSGVLGFGQAIVQAGILEPTAPEGQPILDLGDAPDSTNHFGVDMTAYGSGVIGQYPTVFDPAIAVPPGPSHINPQPMHLGANVTFEVEADTGADLDGINNLDPELDQADQDRADDAFPNPVRLDQFAQCQPTQLQVVVTIDTMVSDLMYLNLWFDWDQNGKWGEAFECASQQFPNSEWGVQNQALSFSGPGVYTINTNAFLPNIAAMTNPEDGMWLRVTLSETQATDADGRGPMNRWQYGETEDYLIGATSVDPTSTPTPQTDPTSTPTPAGQATNTPTPRLTNTPTPQTDPTSTPTPVDQATVTPTPPDQIGHSDLGDAPDSSNNIGSNMLAYIGVPAKYPTVYGGPVPIGPLHHDIRLFHLGGKVTAEREADIGPDQDPTNNIQVSLNTPNRDLADDGLVAPLLSSDYPHCTLVRLEYNIQYNGVVPTKVFFNAWADWNRNGAWGDRMDCPGSLVDEWAVQNEVLTLNPGMNNFGSMIMPWQSPNLPNAFWLRLSVSDTPAPAADGSGPATGWRFGETEDYLIRGQGEPTPTPTAEVTRTPTPTQPPADERSDVGDAPDSSNSFGSTMTAYGGSVTAKFPSVFVVGSPPHGPLHINARQVHLGPYVSFEREADNGPDTDFINNLNPPSDIPDQDKGDDGLLSPTTVQGFPHCRYVKLTYLVTNNTGSPMRMYFNTWADWNRSGEWGDRLDCPNAIVNEWAVQNQLITVNPGANILSAPAFMAWHPTDNADQFWMRLTLSENPATAADGSGPSAGWKLGETEDYLIIKDHNDPTPTPTATIQPSATPTPTATPQPPRDRPDLGDAPDSTNNIGTAMDAYTSVPARFPSVFSGPAPIGPMHLDSHPFYLGNKVSVELEADSSFDSDGFQNIDPANNIADQDRADDGLLWPASLAGVRSCQVTNIRYSVTNTTGTNQQVYFNMWSDWNRNGSWGGVQQCANGLSQEWAVQNQIITVPPGTTIFSSPAFVTYQPFDKPAALWFRMTVSDTAATSDDGSGPANGWRRGETEDYYASPDLGDAPDSYNHAGQGMLAYWFTYARFPTVYDRPGSLPRGPLHHNLGLDYMLGRAITSEAEADIGADQDITNNLVMNIKGSNRDRADDAFGGATPLLNNLRHCTPQRFTYTVTVPSNLPAGSQAYVNVWADWSRNGQWGGVRKCKFFPFFTLLSDEWAVKNQVITIGTQGTYSFTTPYFVPYHANKAQPAWMRISISNTPATSPDGSGPAGGWAKGETEDYLLRSKFVIGTISGTIKDRQTNQVLPRSIVYLIDANPNYGERALVGYTRTDMQGNYTFDDVPEGSYYVLARAADHYSAFYTMPNEPTMRSLVEVDGSDLSGIDITLRHLPVRDVNIASRGSTTYTIDREGVGGFKTIFQRGQFGPIQMNWTGCLTCTLRLDPQGAMTIELRYTDSEDTLFSYPVQADNNTDWQSAIPQADLESVFSTGDTLVEVYLVTNGQAEVVGSIEVMIASGMVTDKTTGQPIEGAHVELFVVPGWTPKTSSEDDSLDSCESAASHSAGEPWTQPAPTEQGITPNPHLDSMSPESASQYTGTNGTFAWNLEPGCWYLRVSAPGYDTTISPLIGLESSVNDVNIELVVEGHRVYLPTVRR